MVKILTFYTYMSNVKHNLFFFFVCAGFEKLSELANLEKLDLSTNAFNVSILETIGSLTSLKTLYIWNCGMRGRIPSRQGNSRA